jgi:hypothetical protein
MCRHSDENLVPTHASTEIDSNASIWGSNTSRLQKIISRYNETVLVIGKELTRHRFVPNSTHQSRVWYGSIDHRTAKPRPTRSKQKNIRPTAYTTSGMIGTRWRSGRTPTNGQYDRPFERERLTKNQGKVCREEDTYRQHHALNASQYNRPLTREKLTKGPTQSFAETRRTAAQNEN